MMLDNISKLQSVVAIPPIAVINNLNTARVSTSLDLQGCGSASLILIPGTNTDADATFALLMEESDDNSSFTTIAAGDLIGTIAQASFTYADDGEAFWIGYKGSKRYIRGTVTPSGNNSGDFFLAGVWLKGHLDQAPAPRN